MPLWLHIISLKVCSRRAQGYNKGSFGFWFYPQVPDRFQPQYHGTDHAAKAAEWARQNLAALGFPGEKVDVDQFYFDISRHWARERLNTQRAFYEALAHEIGI